MIEKSVEIESDIETEIALNPVSEDVILAETDEEILETIIDPYELLKMKNTPSDREFCTLISQLLNRPVSIRDQLTSVIVQAVLFANGAALEKNRPQAHKYADQLKLADRKSVV